MPEGQAAADDPTALREAVLRCHGELRRHVARSHTIQLAGRLDRLHLPWLLIPWNVLRGARLLVPGRRPTVASQDQAVDLYREADGKDEPAASAEVDRLLWQLGAVDDPALDEPMGRTGPSRAAELGGVDRAELEAAAGALLGYYLAGQRTDDELLGEVLAIWADYEDLTEHAYQRLAGRRPLRWRQFDRALETEVGAFRERYLAAWRRWFDRQADQGTAAGPGER